MEFDRKAYFLSSINIQPPTAGIRNPKPYTTRSSLSFSLYHSMASDEIVWQVINQQFCSYKLKSVEITGSDMF